ncbi:phosphatidate cytidylyltransferase [Terrimonas alba]|uniref:phosphatidate cytidylyltransferase n=1 Tax=Terrimonas alba TaxID=3349636 RepID=UPI0035F3E425
MNNLTKRILTGALLIIIITSAIRGGSISFILLTLTINLLALHEFYHLFHSYTGSLRQVTGIMLSLCLVITFALFITNRSDWKILLINIPLAFGIFIRELYLKSQTPFHNLAFIFTGIICITIPLCFFTSIAFLPIREAVYNYEIVLGYFFILWASDSGAFLIGKYFGRHHLFERISPGKTWEGSLGGMFCALLVAYTTSYFFTSLNFINWIIIALIITVTGTFGDLIKSLMKRSLHIKDSGTILPGHGGMLDRFDTLLGSATFIFCFLVLFLYA